MVFLESDTLVALVPEIDSLDLDPARAVLGDLTALAIALGAGLRDARRGRRDLLGAFGHHAIAASGVSAAGT